MNLCASRTLVDFEEECKNGGECNYNNDTGIISCKCPKGYLGNRCEIIENYCSANPCKNGLCKNIDGSYKCTCWPEWTGLNCTEKIEKCSLPDDCVPENTIGVYHSKHS